jgi:hypothetical protein
VARRRVRPGERPAARRAAGSPRRPRHPGPAPGTCGDRRGQDPRSVPPAPTPSWPC